MELYLDSADMQEVTEAFALNFLAGLTTTPTFMQRNGVKDLNATLLQLAEKVPILQIEALGRDCDSIVAEAKRQEELGLDRSSTVYKIPISLEGAKACKQLTDEGFMVNLHLVYTVQQAYLAMNAGATYVCPLVGRLQDQGIDALDLVSRIVDMKHEYGFETKVMFSSVRHNEHVRNAIDLGVDAITVPWKILQTMSDNHMTSMGTEQFYQDHHRMNTLVADVMKTQDCMVQATSPMQDVLLKMTASGYGAVVVVDKQLKPIGVFTDGDLRRLLSQGSQPDLSQSLNSMHEIAPPASIPSSCNVEDAIAAMHKLHVDQLVVTDDAVAIGLIDIQDLL